MLQPGGVGTRIQSSAGFSSLDIDAFDGDAAVRFVKAGVNLWNTHNRPADNFYEIFENGAGGGGRLVIQDGTGRVGIGVTPLDRLHVAGNIRVGTGTNACVRDADATVIAGVCSSDRRFKKDVSPFERTLDRVARLTPVHFLWRATEFPDQHFGTAQSYGLIAQDVQQEFPDLVKVDEQGYLAVNYSKLPLLTLQAIKELKAENSAMEARLSALELALKGLTKQ